jgi:hypothetical protein
VPAAFFVAIITPRESKYQIQKTLSPDRALQPKIALLRSRGHHAKFHELTFFVVFHRRAKLSGQIGANRSALCSQLGCCGRLCVAAINTNVGTDVVAFLKVGHRHFGCVPRPQLPHNRLLQRSVPVDISNRIAFHARHVRLLS